MISIREARSSLGLSQADLAAKLGVHQTTISRFETGDLPVDERTELALDALMLRAAAAANTPMPSGRVAV
jgi:ribosome-binding protein aMBF1 (putative translation factor)